MSDRSANLTSGNRQIDNFIQEMQLKIDNWRDIVFEWIPYNQFSDVTRWIVTIYLATGIISICSKFDTQYATHDTFVVKISLLITRLITSPVNILY